jgi:hypothetical protein
LNLQTKFTFFTKQAILFDLLSLFSRTAEEFASRLAKEGTRDPFNNTFLGHYVRLWPNDEACLVLTDRLHHRLDAFKRLDLTGRQISAILIMEQIIEYQQLQEYQLHSLM